MNTTTSPETERRASAYWDLEPKIHDLTHMAELARYHAVESFGSNPPGETKEEHRERGTALFAVIHLAEMVRELEKAWEAGLSESGSPA